MQISQLVSKRPIKQQQIENEIRPGQIIQGSIRKLHANNKALIQLHARSLTAQLEAVLTVGKRYFFQVQKIDNAIHLKVLREQGQNGNAVKGILQDLNLPVSKINMQFLQQLVNEKIPVTKMQLKHAFSILASLNDKNKSSEILKQMIVQQLPMTKAVFQGLYIKQSTNFSEQLHSVLEQLESLRETPFLNQLKGSMKQIIEPTSLSLLERQIGKEVTLNQTHLFRILQASGAIDHSLPYSEWKASWESFFKGKPLQAQSHLAPFPSIVKQFEQMYQNQSMKRKEFSGFIQQWGESLHKMIHTGKPMAEQQFLSLKKGIESAIYPLLSMNQQQYMASLLQNKPLHLSNLLTLFHLYANESTYDTLKQLIHRSDGRHVDSLTIKNQFLAFIKQTVHLTNANPTTTDMDPSIKTMLMQLLPQTDGVLHDRARQFLHFINGLNIDAVNETNYFIQVSLLLPGEKFLLNKDLQLAFESKKTKDGKIDPDFCRILFLLDLKTMKKTIVDMSVQNRVVSVAIYNDVLKEGNTKFEGLLKDGMQKLDYQLSNVTIKPLHEIDATDERSFHRANGTNIYKGVDYRI